MVVNQELLIEHRVIFDGLHLLFVLLKNSFTLVISQFRDKLLHLLTNQMFHRYVHVWIQSFVLSER